MTDKLLFVLRSVFVVVLMAGCVEDSPPFSYELAHIGEQSQRVVLLHLDFQDYESAMGTGPYTVSVTEAGDTVDVTASVGSCRTFSCTGGLKLEQLTLTLDTMRHPGNLLSFYCLGVDGSLESGLDTIGTGDCR